MLFTLIIGVLESFFAKELELYFQKWQAKRKAQSVANIPLTDSEWSEDAKAGRL